MIFLLNGRIFLVITIGRTLGLGSEILVLRAVICIYLWELHPSSSSLHPQFTSNCQPPLSAQWLITTVGTTGTEGVVEVVGASDAIEVSSYVQASFARN